MANKKPDAAPEEMRSITLLKLGMKDIKPASDNRPLDKQGVAELAKNMKEIGLLHPIIVVPAEDGGAGYVIASGHRRYAAAQSLGWTEINCVARETEDRKVVQYAENLMRRQLTPLEEAEIIGQLRDDKHLTTKEIAAVLGCREAYIVRRSALLLLCAEARKVIDKGPMREWPVGHLENLGALPERQQLEIIKIYKGYDSPPSLKTLMERISNMTRQLKGVRWALDDATLCPKAGACTLCPKRTGANVDMFGALDIAGAKKDDTCLDVACFMGKTDATIKRLVDELRAENAEAPLFRHQGWDNRDDWQRMDRIEKQYGAVDLHDFTAAKRSDEGAIRGLIVAGNRAGEFVYVKKTERSKATTAGGAKKPKKASDKLTKEERAELKRKAKESDNPKGMETALEKQINHQHRRMAWVVNAVATFIREAVGDQSYGRLTTHGKGKAESFKIIREAVMTGNIRAKVAAVVAVFVSGRSWEVNIPRDDKKATEHFDLFTSLFKEWTKAHKEPTPKGSNLLALEMEQTLMVRWLSALPGILGSGVKDHTKLVWIEAEFVAQMIGLDVKTLRAQSAAELPYPKSWRDLVKDEWKNDKLCPPEDAAEPEPKATKKKPVAKKKGKGDGAAEEIVGDDPDFADDPLHGDDVIDDDLED